MNGNISKYLCYDCISDSYLKSYIKKNGTLKDCTFCSKNRECITLEYLSDWIDKIFHENYRPLSTLEILNSHTKNKIIYSISPHTIIKDMILKTTNSAIVEKIVTYLIQKYTSKEKGNKGLIDYKLTFEEIPVLDAIYSKYWADFCQSIKHHQRFFNFKYYKKLEDIFDVIMNYRFSNNKTAIYEIIPDSKEATIYRARIADEKIQKILKNPHKELGAPHHKKSKAGRMNPKGISIFYGSFEKNTCITEIRPPSEAIIVLGEFKIVKPIRVLNLSLFDDPHLSEKVWPSMFHPKFCQEIKNLKFINKFHYEISKPILPADEPLEYIPTQALTEFLANYNKFKIDGIIFASSQTGRAGKNIALFNHSVEDEVLKKSVKKKMLTSGAVLKINPQQLEIYKIIGHELKKIRINNPGLEPVNISLIS